MADDQADLFAEFQEFLTAKRDAESKQQADEDFDIEIWDETGKGVRTRRSHARPFLQSLGLDLDPEPPANTDGKTAPTQATRQSKGPQTQASTVRKYFTKPSK